MSQQRQFKGLPTFTPVQSSPEPSPIWSPPYQGSPTYQTPYTPPPVQQPPWPVQPGQTSHCAARSGLISASGFLAADCGRKPVAVGTASPH